MFYPLSVVKPADGPFGQPAYAVAFNEEEHKALSEAGYEPKYEAPAATGRKKADDKE